jgi:hypothetical protein
MNYLLFTTTRCPKCPEFKEFVADNVTFDGTILDETLPEFHDKIAEYGVANAPTIIVFDGETEVFRGSEVYELEGFLNSSSN